MLCQAREKDSHVQQFTISDLAGWGERVGRPVTFLSLHTVREL